KFAIIAAGEIEAYGALANYLRFGDLGVVEAVVRTAVVAQKLPGEQDIVGRDRLAIGEARGWIERKGDVGPCRLGLDRTPHEAVERKRLVVAARHQAFDHVTADDVGAAHQRRAHALGEQALHDEWIETVEGAEHALHEPAAFGRSWIGIAQLREPRRERRLAVHGNAVAGPLRTGPAPPLRPPQPPAQRAHGE